MAFYEKTFIPKTICDWNELPGNVKDIKSKDSFSLKISDHKPIPRWFSTGDRRVNIWHARLRMKCSELNDDLFSHIHVVDSPQCPCGFRRETSKHFLLDCPLYAVARESLLSDLNKIEFKPTISNLLSGCDKLSDSTNFKAVKIIQRFLLDSKRFS